MKKLYTSLLYLFFLVNHSFGQVNLACDGQRYIDDVFQEVTKTTVVYGFNDNIFGINQNLRMDIYEPEGDTHDQRPVIIFAFGGSFIFGSRQSMESYCEQFARKGYVAATIDYRLGFLGTNEAAVTGAVIRAVSDMKAAVRYFRMDADTDNEFKIHPDFILVGGYSAGAITALHAAYLDDEDDVEDNILDIINDNGGFNGNTGDAENQSYSSEVFAVYNLSGALQRKEYLDEDETEPLVSYHGVDDDIVPIGNGVANSLAEVDGSELLHEQADLHGLSNYIKVVDGGGHVDIHSGILFDDELEEFESQSHLFFHDLMCLDAQTNTTDLSLIQQPVDVFPNPSTDLIQFDFGKIESNYDVRVFDQLGRLVTVFENQNDVIFSLEKDEIGEGVFFVNVLFEEVVVVPLTRKVVFE
ncbi:MAG: carboxylesterase family protein [Bacteroidota bacterium]